MSVFESRIVQPLTWSLCWLLVSSARGWNSDFIFWGREVCNWFSFLGNGFPSTAFKPFSPKLIPRIFTEICRVKLWNRLTEFSGVSYCWVLRSIPCASEENLGFYTWLNISGVPWFLLLLDISGQLSIGGCKIYVMSLFSSFVTCYSFIFPNISSVCKISCGVSCSSTFSSVGGQKIQLELGQTRNFHLSIYCNLTPSVLCSRRVSPAEIFGHNLILTSYFLLQIPPFSLRICLYNISKNGPSQSSWNFETKELETALGYGIFCSLKMMDK